MAKTNNLHDFLVDLANAIRAKKKYPDSQKINPQDFSDEIDGISGGDNKLASVADGTITEVTEEDLEGVTLIRDYAFYKQGSLERVSLPRTVLSIGNYSFHQCGKLASFTINQGVTSIGLQAFVSSSLTNVEIPSSVTSIDNGAFANCTKLRTITFDDNSELTQIGTTVFQACPITSIAIPEGVTTIGSECFRSCTNLVNISIPDSVTSIGQSAFSGCSSLVYNDYNGGKYLGNSENPYLVLIQGTATSGIHENTKIIYQDAFKNCVGLTSITVPDGVIAIGSGVFSGCSSLVEITLPFIGDRAGVTSSDTYQYPLGYIFGTTSYTGGTQTSQTYYGYSASTTTSTSYYIPSSLKKVTVTGGNILYGAFYNCRNLTDIILPDGLESIGAYAFFGCTNIVNVPIPVSVVHVGQDTFNSCSSITEIEINENMTYVGRTAFSGCSKLETVYWNAKNCGSGGYSSYEMFKNCSSLTNIIIGNAVESIPNYAFKTCKYITSMTIPDSVTQIGAQAFDGCSGLVNVEIGSGIDAINNLAFYNCTSLTSVAIGNGIKRIEDNVFANCSKLASVTFEGTPTYISRSAFTSCYALLDIYVPWAQGAVAGAPWAASKATIHYNWTPTPPEVTDLTGTTWRINSSPAHFSVPTTFDVQCSDGSTSMYFESSYGGTWDDDSDIEVTLFYGSGAGANPTVTIASGSDATNTTLIDWFKANATQVT